jgi:hypothetical protein
MAKVTVKSKNLQKHNDSINLIRALMDTPDFEALAVSLSYTPEQVDAARVFVRKLKPEVKK